MKDQIILSGYTEISLRVVQLANRRKVRVAVQRNTNGDTPSISMAAHADLRICGEHVILKDLLGSCSIY